jgi:hypothetical protein
LSIGNSLEGKHTSIDKTPNLTILGVRDCSAGRRTVSGFLVGGGFGVIHGKSRVPQSGAYTCCCRKDQSLTTIHEDAISRL